MMIKFDVEHPSELELRAIDVHELLPQQEPFVMIGSLVYFDRTLTITETKVQADNIFVDENHFSASGLMENIAQTCAARIGYVNKFILKKAIQLGFIGGIRNFEVIELPVVGDKEKQENKVAVRRKAEDLGSLDLDDFIAQLQQEIADALVNH